MKRRKLAAVFFAAVTVLGFAAAAGAVDGTIDINQAKVLAAGGFPFTISTSGSYRLTGNLTVPLNTNGIVVGANFLTIDLNGFSITGPGSGTGTGIISGLFGGITVENGAVTGFHDGVVLGADSIVKSVHADLNANNGITAGNNSVIAGCTANSNGNLGITAGDNSGVEGCTANSNTAFGIDCSFNGCTISNNAANGNNIGIRLRGSGGVILHNTSINNSHQGIEAADNTTGYGENVLTLDGIPNVTGGTSMKNNVCNGALC